MGRKKTINIRDLFIEPNFNELEAVSTDSKGGPKKLSQAQLESLRRTGEFQVDKRSRYYLYYLQYLHNTCRWTARSSAGRSTPGG